MMSLRTGSEARSTTLTEGLETGGDAMEIVKHFYKEAVESTSLTHVEAFDPALVSKCLT